jgi:hypothetical protein
MGKGKRGRGSPRHAGDKRKRDPSPPSEDFGDSEHSEEEVSSKSEGLLALASPPTLSDDLDDSQGIAAEVWTYIRSIERTGLEESDESEVSSDVEDSFGSSEERSGAATTATTRAVTVAATAMTAAKAKTVAARAAKATVAAAAARPVARRHWFK